MSDSRSPSKSSSSRSQSQFKERSPEILIERRNDQSPRDLGREPNSNRSPHRDNGREDRDNRPRDVSDVRKRHRSPSDSRTRDRDKRHRRSPSPRFSNRYDGVRRSRSPREARRSYRRSPSPKGMRRTPRSRSRSPRDYRRNQSPPRDNRRNQSPPRREVQQRERYGGERHRIEELPEQFSIHKGQVSKIESFGCFVSLPGFRKQGLVHISQLTQDRVNNVSDIVREGQHIWVKVKEVVKSDDARQQKIALSMKACDQETGHDLDPDNEMTFANNRTGGGGGGGDGRRNGGISAMLPELYSVYKGTVGKIESFGCFVEIEGFRKNGLVHKSQLASYRVEEVSDAVAVGDTVWVKVIEATAGDTPRDAKLSLSMKLVDQASGKDLDPTNEDAQEEAAKRGGGGHSHAQAPIELGAVFNTVCSKCGQKGHYSSECFSREGEKYDIVAEDPAEVELSGGMRGVHGVSAQAVSMGRGRGAVQPAWMTDTAGPTMEEEGGKKKKHKKEKKAKKGKKEKKEKKNKKDKKEKKHKKSKSSSDK